MPIETTGKAIDALKGTPVILALLIVICGTLVFAAYLLGVVASAAGERNKAQLQLIESLVKDIRDCRTTRTSARQLILDPHGNSVRAR
jgi:hypothetical protein